MNKNKVRILEIVFLSLAILIAVGFMFKDKFNTNPGSTSNTGSSEMLEANAVSEEITKDVVVFQKFTNKNKSIKKVALVFNKLYSPNNVNIAIELIDNNNKTVIKKIVSVDSIKDQHRTYLEADTPITGLAGKELTIRVYPVSNSDTGLALMYNDSTGSEFKFGSKNVKGTICFSVTSE